MIHSRRPELRIVGRVALKRAQEHLTDVYGNPEKLPRPQSLQAALAAANAAVDNMLRDYGLIR